MLKNSTSGPDAGLRDFTWTKKNEWFKIPYDFDICGYRGCKFWTDFWTKQVWIPEKKILFPVGTP
jgi:hypothetical protein